MTVVDWAEEDEEGDEIDPDEDDEADDEEDEDEDWTALVDVARSNKTMGATALPK